MKLADKDFYCWSMIVNNIYKSSVAIAIEAHKKSLIETKCNKAKKIFAKSLQELHIYERMIADQ